jgi:hypothetical protein
LMACLARPHGWRSSCSGGFPFRRP